MSHAVTLIPGDGIGPEITEAALQVIDATGVSIDWKRADCGEVSLRDSGSVLPDSLFDAVRETKVALKGPVGTPIGGGHRSVNVTIRQTLGLYACVRPVKSLPGIESRYGDVDLVIVRENTEGLYSGLEHEVVPGVVEGLKIVTAEASERIARFAFALAKREGREKVTAVHKANIMKLADGLFLDRVRAVHAGYPEITREELIVDNCAMQLVRNPQRFQVLVMSNLYGDILSDLCAGLVGGLGVVPGANFGDDLAIFEPVHGTAPDIAGKGWANPTALLLSAGMMLDHLGEAQAASALRAGIERVLADGEVRTRDLGGDADTGAFAAAVAAAVGAG
jgi:isocitrate dehydrogenase (NAD+)